TDHRLQPGYAVSKGLISDETPTVSARKCIAHPPAEDDLDKSHWDEERCRSEEQSADDSFKRRHRKPGTSSTKLPETGGEADRWENEALDEPLYEGANLIRAKS